MCLAAAKAVAVVAAKLLLARWESWYMYGDYCFFSYMKGEKAVTPRPARM